MPFRTILCPTDFSDCARAALHLAGSLANVHHARLVLLHVIDVQYGPHGYGGVMVEVRPPDYPRQMFEALRQLTTPYPEVQVEYLLAEGQPGEEVVRIAREKGCDLIVMGTHGRTGLAHLFLGSVAEEVLRQAPCPVLTVRVPLDAAPRPVASAAAAAD